MSAGKADRSERPADRINVLFLMIHMNMGGTERLVFNLVRHLDRRLFAPSIAWFVEDEPLPEFEALGVPLFHVPKQGRFDWSAMRRLAAIVREHRIDVVNAHHFMSFVYAFYAAKIANRARLVYTEHSEADVLSAADKWQVIGRYLLKSSDGVIGVSEKVSRTVSSHFKFDPSRIRTIENGIDVEMFRADSQDRDRLRESLGIAPGHTAIGLVANFKRNKNHLFLLKAIREVVQRRNDVRLVFIGQGFAGDRENSEPEIREFITQNGLEGVVQLTGYRPDVHDLLRALDVFSLVSHKEGLPLSLIEAMATGLPVIGTDIDAIRGVVDPEVNGLLVRPDDVPALVRAIERLVSDSDLRRRMGSESRRLAHGKYSLTRCVQDTEDLFSSLSRHRPASLEVRPSTIA